MCFLHSLVFLRTPPSFCLCPQESFGFRELIPQASWLSDPLTSFQETAFLAPNLPAFLSFFGHLEIIVFTFFFLEMVILPRKQAHREVKFHFCFLQMHLLPITRLPPIHIQYQRFLFSGHRGSSLQTPRRLSPATNLLAVFLREGRSLQLLVAVWGLQ